VKPGVLCRIVVHDTYVFVGPYPSDYNILGRIMQDEFVVSLVPSIKRDIYLRCLTTRGVGYVLSTALEPEK
jgi:hypothetical protein